MNLKEQLQAAWEAVRSGNVEGAAEAVAALKELPRTSEGVFDLTSVDGDVWWAAGLAYPVYVAYETSCNKKEGYPDLIAQMRAWNSLLQRDYSFHNAARAAHMWIYTIMNMSPEIYEYYRELVDIFKENARETTRRFYEVTGKISAALKGDALAADEDASLFKAAVAAACERDILLAEKYEKFC